MQIGAGLATITSEDAGGLVIGESTFVNNTAEAGGGIYRTDSDNITISNNTQITGNSATVNGGGVACINCLELTLQLQANLTQNQAYTSGGACHVTNYTGFTSDQAQYNGNWQASCVRIAT